MKFLETLLRKTSPHDENSKHALMRFWDPMFWEGAPLWLDSQAQEERTYKEDPSWVPPSWHTIPPVDSRLQHLTKKS